MALPPDKERQLNEAAEKARAEFRANWQNWSILDLAQWLERWRWTAAYDRLCKVIIEETGAASKGVPVPEGFKF